MLNNTEIKHTNNFLNEPNFNNFPNNSDVINNNLINETIKNPEENQNSLEELNNQNLETNKLNAIKKEDQLANQTPLKASSLVSNNFMPKSNAKISNSLNTTKAENSNTNNNLIEREEKEIFKVSKKDNFAFFQPNLEAIKKYQVKLDAQNATENITKFYSMKGEEIEFEEYFENMKNYFLDVAKLEKNKLLNKNWSNVNNQNATIINNNNPNEQVNCFNKLNRKKIIYIHDSALQIRSNFHYWEKIFYL